MANKLIGRRIRERREEQNLTQTQCAAAMLLPRQNWGRWESGEKLPSIDNLVSICHILQCSADWLLGLSNSKKPPE